MCRWMGSHFDGWIDYKGVALSLELLEWDPKFSELGGQVGRDIKMSVGLGRGRWTVFQEHIMIKIFTSLM